jgi:hypothetical protein
MSGLTFHEERGINRINKITKKAAAAAGMEYLAVPEQLVSGELELALTLNYPINAARIIKKWPVQHKRQHKSSFACSSMDNSVPDTAVFLVQKSLSHCFGKSSKTPSSKQMKSTICKLLRP